MAHTTHHATIQCSRGSNRYRAQASIGEASKEESIHSSLQMNKESTDLPEQTSQSVSTFRQCKEELQSAATNFFSIDTVNSMIETGKNRQEMNGYLKAAVIAFANLKSVNANLRVKAYSEQILDTVEYILTQQYADPNFKNEEGRNLISLALQRSYDLKSDALHARYHYGKRNLDALLELLVKHGTDVNLIYDKKTLLGSVCEKSCPLKDALYWNVSAVSKLLQLGADPRLPVMPKQVRQNSETQAICDVPLYKGMKRFCEDIFVPQRIRHEILEVATRLNQAEGKTSHLAEWVKGMGKKVSDCFCPRM